MALTNQEKQAAFYARGRDIPRTLAKYRLALAEIYLCGRAEERAGVPVRPADQLPLPGVSHGRR